MAKDVAIVQAQRLSGNVGDVLTKTESGVKWQPPQGGPGGGVPDGGEENDVLARDLDGGLKWMPLQDGWTVDSELDASSSNPVRNRAVANALADKQGKLPHGSAGLFLMHGRGSDSYSWAAALPDGGAPGDVLTRIGEAGIGWAALNAGSPTGLIDSELDASSSNPVKNKAICAGLELKQDKLPGGDTGKYLRMTGGGPAWLDVSWSGAAVSGLPAGGTKGQVLARTSDSYSWVDALELPEGAPGQVLSLNEELVPYWAAIEEFPECRAAGKVLSVDASNALVWRDVSFSGTGVPDGGDENDVLARDADGGLKWMPIPAELPDDGVAGKYLRKTADGLEWADVSVSTALPDGGEIGDVLTLDSAGPVWAQVEKELPGTGRTAGKVLTITSGNDVAWESARYALDLPLEGGVDGQLPQRDGSDTVSWVDAYNLPYGLSGQVLVIGDNGKPAWADPADLYGNGASIGERLDTLSLQLESLEERIAALEALHQQQ